ncbi:MAG: hypothetical protein WAM60_12320 [Candidatus Promineifilaceae bacterium]
MIKVVRIGLCMIAVVQLFFAAAFFLQLPFAVSLWPFEGTTALSFIFISSIFAAAAAPTLWAALTEQYAILAGIALDYVGILLPVAVYSFQLGAAGESGLTVYGIICLFGVLFGLGLLWWSLRFPLDSSLPTPGLVRGAFVFFIIALAIVSFRLITQVPNAFPWSVTPELSVIIGWMFVGAAVYFIYGLFRPVWSNAAGQLLGFLAYDLVLVAPFLTRLPTVADENRLGLTVYTAVVVLSGFLAIYYLFIYRPTRAATWRLAS